MNPMNPFLTLLCLGIVAGLTVWVVNSSLKEMGKL